MKGRRPGLDALRRRMAEPYSGPMPTPPPWLNVVAKMEWDRILPQIMRAGTFDPADVTILAAYCRAFAAWLLCEQAVEEDGLMIEGSTGNLVLHPAARHRVQLLGELRKLAVECGFTPNARTRIDAPAPQGKESDDFDNL